MLTSSRYELLVKIASGGMATVYVGRLRGAAGFWRLCAIKRAHGHLVEDAALRKMLVTEARLASKIHHPNVVAVDDVEELAGELRLVMDYVEGAALSELASRKRDVGPPLPARIAMRIALDACAGLHAAHELHDDAGEPMRLVHRDVSPQNILVGVDGTSRIADFGIAKCARSSMSTTTGAIKGKLGYMAPEYIEGSEPDAKSDVFALGVVVWEALAQRKLFRGSNDVDTLKRVVAAEAPPVSSVAPWVGTALDDVLATALAKSPADRFDSARAFGNALEAAARKDDLIGSHTEVAAHVQATVGEALATRRAQIRERIGHSEAAPQTTQPHERVPLPAPQELSDSTPPPPVQDEASTLAGSGVTSNTSTTSSNILPDGVPAPRRLAPALLVAAVALAIGAVGFVIARSASTPATAETADSVVTSAAQPPPVVSTGATQASAPPTAPVSAAPAVSAPSRPAPAPTFAKTRAAGDAQPAVPKPPATAAPKETVAPNPYAAPTR